jgi:hypothetical protein
MNEPEKRLFVGIKISSKLQTELDHCARGTEHYFKQNKPEYLQLVSSGDDKLIGRFLRDGFPVNDIDNVSRNVRSIITLIAPGYRIAEDCLRIYTDPEAGTGRPA